MRRWSKYASWSSKWQQWPPFSQTATRLLGIRLPIFVMSSPRGPVPLTGNVGDVSIYDVAPTLLTYFGCPVPSDMIGRSLLRG